MDINPPPQTSFFICLNYFEFSFLAILFWICYFWCDKEIKCGAISTETGGLVEEIMFCCGKQYLGFFLHLFYFNRRSTHVPWLHCICSTTNYWFQHGWNNAFLVAYFISYSGCYCPIYFVIPSCDCCLLLLWTFILFVAAMVFSVKELHVWPDALCFHTSRWLFIFIDEGSEYEVYSRLKIAACGGLPLRLFMDESSECSLWRPVIGNIGPYPVLCDYGVLIW